MLLADIAKTSALVGATGGRLEKIERIADLLRRTDPRDLETSVCFLTGKLRQGRIGIGGAAIGALRSSVAAPASTLDLHDVDAALEAISSAAGPGSSREKRRIFHDLLTRATRDEQDFLIRLLFGELRQGALEGVMVEAVGKAAGVPLEILRRAVMNQGSIESVAAIALTEGEAGLRRFAVRLFRPVRPMLAQPVDGLQSAIDRLGEATLEYKLDGARVQVHKEGEIVRVYTRHLREVTEAVPDIVEAASSLPAQSAILDGEAIAIQEGGTPHPFQVTMRRLGRRLDVERQRESLPLSLFLFDVLYLNDEVMIDRPLAQRIEGLEEASGRRLIVPRITTSLPEEAEAFLARALSEGHEGIMAKAPDAAYEAGGRGFAWLKVKRVETLDLVVLAAEWGHGRRKGWLSNLHLGARDPARGGFVMLGKTFKGLTDEMLAWQTEKLLSLEIGRDSYTVYVRPELVVEIAFGDVQASPRYPGGLALRFARVKRFRGDKPADQADTIDRLRGIKEKAAGRTG